MAVADVRPSTFSPPEVLSVQDTGLSETFLAELVLRVIYFAGTITGRDVANQVRLPFVNVVEKVLDYLKRQMLCEVRSGSTLTPASYEYALTSRGHQKALEFAERCTYAGPAPVPLRQYWDAVSRQSIRDVVVTREDMLRAYSHLVVSERLLNQLGPAINSGRSTFLFGPPGNGKTVVAEAAAKVLGGAIYVPHAVEYDSQVIKVFDPICHKSVGEESKKPDGSDRRWVLSRRPVVIVGGELTLATLDLVWSETSHYYEAPFQLKANGGMFLIDDFGRQQISPRDLLNRWIVPLEKKEDYLNLRTGQEIAVPFDQLIIFSTNLEPRNLVDEAFLRRIRYKVEVANPTPEEYREVFQRVCQAKGVPFEESGLEFVLEYYDRLGIEPRFCHPRDVLDQLVDIAHYVGGPPVLSPDLLQLACESYFVRL